MKSGFWGTVSAGLAIILLFVTCVSCGSDNSEPTIVYIKENDQYARYYMMPGEYDGKTMYLRAETLGEKLCFNSSATTGSCGGYYPGSELDKYLTDTFSTRFSDEMLALIEDTSIKVVTNDSVWEHSLNAETETIERKFFALAAREMGITGSAPQDGKELKGISKIEKGNVHWLRSPGGDDDHHAYAFGEETYGTELVVAEFDVRPAFTLSKEIKPVLKDDIVDGKQVYVIEP